MNLFKKITISFLNKQISASSKLLDFISNKKKLPAYRDALISFLEKNLTEPKGKILDLGSGQWTWTKDKLSKNSACELISFDKFKSTNIDVVGDMLELDKYFNVDYFDMIICTEVMEHVSNPFLAINKMAIVLKSGGILLISCTFDYPIHGEDYGDYWRITRQGWQELLKNNFKKIEISWLGEELKPKDYFIKAIKK